MVNQKALANVTFFTDNNSTITFNTRFGYKVATIFLRFLLHLWITENVLFGKALFKLHLNVDSECVF